MVRKPSNSDNSRPPEDFAQTTPRDLHPTSDIRFVMVETAKLTAEVKNLQATVSEHAGDIKELRRWIIGGILAIGAGGIGAVIWANGKFEKSAEQLGEITKSAAVMQIQSSAYQDDIKEIKAAVTKENNKKATQ